MDAVTVAAALAIVVDESREAAMRELLLERERLAMTVADRDSFLAQRHHVVSAQALLPGRLMTWQHAYHQRHNDYLDAEHAMRDALRALQRGDGEAAEQHLIAAVGSEQSVEDVEEEEATDDAMEAEEEEEEGEEDAEVEPA